MPNSLSQLSARLQADRPLQQEQPDYTRWLLESFAPAESHWHQENFPLAPGVRPDNLD